MKIVLATSNKGKIKEFYNMNLFIDFVCQQDLGISSVPETGHTFVENALIKARHASLESGLPAIADDSGLVIPSLNGEPGIYSSRYAGDNDNGLMRINKVLANLKDMVGDKRNAYFHSCIVYLKSACDPVPVVVTGTWHGVILDECRGDNGMGYDPIFYVPTHNCSAAELSMAEKNKISHRGIAMRSLLPSLTQ